MIKVGSLVEIKNYDQSCVGRVSDILDGEIKTYLVDTALDGLLFLTRREIKEVR
jgi:hypothetical protein